MSVLLPILHPYEWAAEHPNTIKEALLGEAPHPWISFVYDQGEYVQYPVLNDAQPEAEQKKAMMKEAIQNLAQYQVEIAHQPLGKIDMLLVGGKEFAAEKILDRHFMGQISQQLNRLELYAAVPQKGSLMIIPADNSHGQLFAEIVHEFYRQPKTYPISDLIFHFKEGSLVNCYKNTSTSK